MSQTVGPSGYAPPPGSVPPSGYAPPPRQGRPWWFWVLSGCGGCAAVVVIVGIIGFLGLLNFAKKTMKSVGPVTQASVQKSLGADLPLYPRATLNPTATQATLTGIRAAETLLGRQAGSMLRGLGFYQTPDAPEKIISFYDAQMKQRGWKVAQSQDMGIKQQRGYQKGNEMVIVQVQPGGESGGTVLIVMRGGPEITQVAPSAGTAVGR